MASSISTLVANTVSIQEAEKGRDTARRELRRPHLSTTELRRPPSSAPSREREANHEVCWGLSTRCGPPDTDRGWARLASAGDE